MISVGVNPPKTPVTEGSMDVAAATMPNVCKMPGPPAPFVPTPLPNIGTSGDNLTDATSTVLISGKKVAIKGSYYMSQPSPDVASQGTGGGIVSSKVQGKTEFVAPGSMTVKAEGKNIQLLGDAMTNNGASPPNSGTAQNVQAPSVKPMHECGDCGPYGKLQDSGRAQAQNPGETAMERDHIPAKATLRERAFKLAGADRSEAIDTCIANAVEAKGIAVAIPRSMHRSFSPTCGSKNKSLMHTDAQSAKKLEEARDRDLADMTKAMEGTPCAAAYAEAAKKIKAHDNEKMLKEVVAKCTGN